MKRIQIILVLIIALAMLVACGGNDAKQDSDLSDQVEETAQEKDDAEKKDDVSIGIIQLAPMKP